MIRTRIPAPAIPGFDPVPRQSRRGGWTPERQRGFIAHLAATGNVTASVDAIGLSVMGAYHLRAAPGAASFRRAWDAALDAGIAGLRSIAFDRAINGTPETRLYHGKPCVETVRYDNQLLSMILRQYDKGAGQGRREASAFAEQIEPTDVAERMWHWALRDSGKHKMRVFVERIRVQVAQHFQKALTSNPDTLDGIVASFDYSLRQAIENRAQNERRANGGPETLRENARHCSGTVSWKPLDATSFARAQAVRTRLRRDAGDE